MTNIKYIRDSYSKALLMADETVIEDFLQKKSRDIKLEELETSINIVKQEIKELRESIQEKHKKG